MCDEFGAKSENLFERRHQIVYALRRRRLKSQATAFVLGQIPLGSESDWELHKIWMVLRGGIDGPVKAFS